MFTVCLVEVREFFLEIEAETEEEASEIALEAGSDQSVRDCFREHNVDWVEPVDGT